MPDATAGTPHPSRAAHGVPRLAAESLVVVRAGRRIVDGASLAVHAGEVVTLQGASGCGKTTLLRALATLSPVEGGRVLLDGVDSARIAPSVFRSRVAYVAQQPVMLEGTVTDNVAAGPRLHGRDLSPDALATLLGRAALPASMAASVARTLSGGERQRVALARALANQPEAVLLDEPTAALDPAAADRVLALVRSLAAGGLAVIVVTHAVEHAHVLGGTAYHFAEGKLTRAETSVPAGMAL